MRFLSRNVLRFLSRYLVYRGNDTAYLRSLGMEIGPGTSISLRTVFVGSEPWLIRLGSGVTVTHGVHFVTHDGATRVYRSSHESLNQMYGNNFGMIVVKDNSFIGLGSILLPGVTVGPNSIVGAGSVVTKDVPPQTVAGGNPAKVLASLEEYEARSMAKALPLKATSRAELRRELEDLLPE